MNGEKIGGLTPFRRALEEDLVDPRFMVRIGLRGTLQSADEVKEQFEWAQQQVIQALCVRLSHSNLEGN